WQVMMSSEYRKSPAMRAILARHGGARRWFRDQIAPAVADLVYRSMFESFAHFELHSQNVDVLLGPDGDVLELFVKDLSDVVHDPAMEAASGKTPNPSPLREPEWGDMGQGSGVR